MALLLSLGSVNVGGLFRLVDDMADPDTEALWALCSEVMQWQLYILLKYLLPAVTEPDKEKVGGKPPEFYLNTMA